ncbi:hypothetical protein EDB87DRAFT_1832022, partial [Lactarius vividus]
MSSQPLHEPVGPCHPSLRVCMFLRLRPELGKDVDLTSCRGLLTDLNHAIEWRKVPPTPSRDRWGTLPFIALR